MKTNLESFHYHFWKNGKKEAVVTVSVKPKYKKYLEKAVVTCVVSDNV